MQTQVKIPDADAAMEQLLEMLAERAAEEWLRGQNMNNNYGDATNEHKDMYLRPIQHG